MEEDREGGVENEGGKKPSDGWNERTGDTEADTCKEEGSRAGD